MFGSLLDAAAGAAGIKSDKKKKGDAVPPASAPAAAAAAAPASSSSSSSSAGHAGSSPLPGATSNSVHAEHYAANSSSATGNKRALLIGINYIGHEQGVLNGCINDTINVERYLTTEWGYAKENIRRLNDDKPDAMPTKANMLAGMQWLVEGAKSGDSLFLHYSGHGSQTSGSMTATVLESTGKDNTICPVDYPTAGQITDNEMHALMCKKLPAGVRLTIIFDSCHSGTAMDLPFEYNPPQGDQFHDAQEAGGGFGGFMSRHANVNVACLAGGVKGVALEVGKHVANEALYQGSAFVRPKLNAALNETKADVFMISGCRDDQTSADATLDGSATGAMSYALLTVLKREKKTNYTALIHNMRDLLHNGERKFTQMPCLSFGRQIDPDMEVYF